MICKLYRYVTTHLENKHDVVNISVLEQQKLFIVFIFLYLNNFIRYLNIKFKLWLI